MNSSFAVFFMGFGPVLIAVGILMLLTLRNDNSVYSSDRIGAGAFMLVGGIAILLIGAVDYFDLYNYFHFLTKYWE